jgi:hypothetical protein
MNPKLQGATFASNTGLLTATGAETVYDTTVIIDYCINGKAYRKAAVTDGATPTTDINTGAAFPVLTANKGAVAVFMMNAAGTVAVAMSGVHDLDEDGNFKVTPQFPPVPANQCPFAYQILKAGSTAGTITFGSSNWNATGFTNTIQNVLVLPDRPQG